MPQRRRPGVKSEKVNDESPRSILRLQNLPFRITPIPQTIDKGRKAMLVYLVMPIFDTVKKIVRPSAVVLDLVRRDQTLFSQETIKFHQASLFNHAIPCQFPAKMTHIIPYLISLYTWNIRHKQEFSTTKIKNI